MLTAKVFWNGKSQAVRLPKECRFDGEEVYIKKMKNGIFISPKIKTDWRIFFNKYEPCWDFETDRIDNIASQERNLF